MHNGAKKGRILVIRPKLRAQQTLVRLQQLALPSMPMPLIELYPLSIPPPPLTVNAIKQEDIKQIVVTSATSFYFIDKSFLKTIEALPFYCIGHETAHSARYHGCSNIKAIAKDVDEFIEYYSALAGPILYLCGRRRRRNLESNWAKNNIKYKLLELYETRPCQQILDQILAGRICLDSVNIVMLASSYSAQICNLILDRLPACVKFVCFSKRIANFLPPSRLQDIYICAYPDEASALALIVNLNSR